MGAAPPRGRPAPPAPPLDFDEVTEIVSDLAQLNFFPTGAGGLAVVKLFGESLCSTLEQVRWLVGRLLVLYNKWPGPAEVRAVFCKRYPPKDGIDTRNTHTSEFFPDGNIPCEIPESLGSGAFLALPPVPGRPLLPPGDARPWPEDELEIAREELSRVMEQKRAERRRLPAPVVTPQVLGRGDIERAAAELRKLRRAPHVFEAGDGDRCRVCWLPVTDRLHSSADE